MGVHKIVQVVVIKNIPKKKKGKKTKWFSEEAVNQLSKEEKQKAKKRSKRQRREAKGKEEKEIYIHLNAEFQRIAKRDKTNKQKIPSSVINAKKQSKAKEFRERLEISSRKLEIPREHLMQ